VVAAVVANCFGDRWSFLQVCGYLWVIAGLVAQAWNLENAASAADGAGDTAAEAAAGIEEPETAVAV
jgi:hypothetical protein